MTTTATTTAPEVPSGDLATVVSSTDPYPTYAKWRRDTPVVGVGPRQWAVTRYGDVARLLRDRRVGHQLPREYLTFAFGEGALSDFQCNSLLRRDQPDHTRLRRLMSQSFTRAMVLERQPWITALVDEMLAPMLDGSPFDVVEQLAFPLPVAVICDLMGIPPDDWGAVGERVEALSGVDAAAAGTSITWLRGYFDAILSGVRPDRDGGLLARMLAAEEGDDALSYQEVIDNAALLFFAGFETTKHLIAGGVAALLSRPDQQARLWGTPGAVSRAVEEFVRFDAPVQFVVVYVREPVQIAEHELAAGEVLYLLLGSANHDTTVFTDPASLDIERDPNPHVGFGGGVHLCLGATLARVEAEVVFTRLAATVRTLEPAGEAERRPSTMGSIRHLPVRAAPR
jgi:cytochrome P450